MVRIKILASRLRVRGDHEGTQFFSFFPLHGNTSTTIDKKNPQMLQHWLTVSWCSHTLFPLFSSFFTHTFYFFFLLPVLYLRALPKSWDAPKFLFFFKGGGRNPALPGMFSSSLVVVSENISINQYTPREERRGEERRGERGRDGAFTFSSLIFV